jgi:hypothetical protein
LEVLVKRAVRRVSTLLFTAYAAVVLVGAVPVDSAVIVDSGSTNSRANQIVVRSDGTASIASGTSSPTPFTVPKAVAARFFTALAAAREDNAPSGSCAKSASFGSTIRVKWHGWVSSDVTCPPPGDVSPAAMKDAQALNNSVMEIRVLAGPPHSAV